MCNGNPLKLPTKLNSQSRQKVDLNPVHLRGMVSLQAGRVGEAPPLYARQSLSAGAAIDCKK